MLKKNEYINDNNCIKDCQIIKNLYNDFISNHQELMNNYVQLKNVCLKDENLKCFKEYAKILSKIILGSEKKQELILNKYVLPFDIIEMELNEENSRIIHQIQ